MVEEQDKRNSVEAYKRDPQETVRMVYSELRTIALDQSHEEHKFATRVCKELRGINLDTTSKHAKPEYAITVMSAVSMMIKSQAVHREGQITQMKYPAVTRLIIGLSRYPLLLPKEYEKLTNEEERLAEERKNLSRASISKIEANISGESLQQTKLETDLGQQHMLRELWLTLIGLFVWIGRGFGVGRLVNKKPQLQVQPEPQEPQESI